MLVSSVGRLLSVPSKVGGGGGGREPGRLESGRRERKGWEAGVLRGREAERNVNDANYFNLTTR